MAVERGVDPAERDQPRTRFADPQVGQLAVDRLLALLAAAQHGVVTRGQLLELGLSRSAIGRRLERGLLHSLHRGVYAVGHPSITRHGRWLAAVLSAGGSAVLSHRSAGALWGLCRDSRAEVEVTVPAHLHGRVGMRIHAAPLPDEERTRHDRIPTTDTLRTLLDLAAIMGPGPLQRAADLAGLSRRQNRVRLASLIDRHRGKRGIATIGAILAAAERDAAIPRSELERRFRAFVRDYRLPEPLINGRVLAAGRAYEPDISWPDRRVVVELDGFDTHGTRQAFEADRERDRRLAVAGWLVVRITWRQLRDEPAVIAAQVRALLGGDGREGR